MACTTANTIIELTIGDTLQATVAQIFNSTTGLAYDLTGHTAVLAVARPGVTTAIFCVDGILGPAQDQGVVAFEFTSSESDLFEVGTYNGTISIETDGKEATVVGSVKYRILAKIECPVL